MSEALQWNEFKNGHAMWRIKSTLYCIFTSSFSKMWLSGDEGFGMHIELPLQSKASDMRVLQCLRMWLVVDCGSAVCGCAPLCYESVCHGITWVVYTAWNVISDAHTVSLLLLSVLTAFISLWHMWGRLFSFWFHIMSVRNLTPQIAQEWWDIFLCVNVKVITSWENLHM